MLYAAQAQNITMHYFVLITEKTIEKKVNTLYDTKQAIRVEPDSELMLSDSKLNNNKIYSPATNNF